MDVASPNSAPQAHTILPLLSRFLENLIMCSQSVGRNLKGRFEMLGWKQKIYSIKKTFYISSFKAQNFLLNS